MMELAGSTPTVSFGFASSSHPFHGPQTAHRFASVDETYPTALRGGGDCVSGSGNSFRRTDHVEAALDEARFWAEELQKAEYRGLGDTREAARYRVAQKTGIAESYLKRLRYKWREMGEVAGSQYRALMLAYNDMAQRNEAAARQYRAERQQLREQRHEADLERALASVGTDGACRREMAE